MTSIILNRVQGLIDDKAFPKLGTIWMRNMAASLVRRILLNMTEEWEREHIT